MTAGIEIRKLNKSYGSTHVLRDIDLAVEPGGFTVLLGPSGCGKSTLLSAIAGLDDVDDGQIVIGGVDVIDEEPSRRGIAMVFQSYALYPTMTVRRNLSFGLQVARVPRAEIDRRVAWAADLLQLTPMLERRPGQLSGGQRQRVAIGRALVREAKVFLFDEPLSNLDAKLRTEMRVEIKRLHQQLRSTIVYVTHDQVEAMTLATRIAVMNGGRIEQYADPQTLYDSPASVFVAEFVGSPAMSLLKARLVPGPDRPTAHLPGGIVLPLDGYRFREGVPIAAEREVTLGVRPEDVHIDDAGVEGKVTFVEPMGADTLAWFDLSGQRISARLTPARARDLVGAARLRIDPAKVSIFDPASGERL